MAKLIRGSVFRPVVTRAATDGKRRKFKSKYYWAEYRDGDGKMKRHVLTLTNDCRICDKDVARHRLREILAENERVAAGLIDPFVESASMPIRVVVARYIRHLRRKRRGRRHVDQVLSYLKWIVTSTGMKRLSDFNEDRIDKALGKLVDAGRSARTVNVYRRCAYALGEWCVKISRVLDRNPAVAIERRNEAIDQRKIRRSLTLEEARRLLEIAGPRKLYYSVALLTGFRVSEIQALEWRDIHLDGDRPHVLLRAETTKSKRSDELPLHSSLVLALRHARPDLSPPNSRIFSTVPRLKTFKRDLDRASIPFEDGQGRTIDRHALKTTFVSWLGLYGVDHRAQGLLARHAPQGITLKHYQDFSLFDLWSEIEKIPSPLDGAEVNTAIATGTDDSQAVVGNVVGACGFDRPQGALCGRVETESSSEKSARKHYNTRQDLIISSGNGLPTPGLEPGTSCSTGRRSSQLSYAGIVATNRHAAETFRKTLLGGAREETPETITRKNYEVALGIH